MDVQRSAPSPVDLLPAGPALPDELVAAIERCASYRQVEPGTVLLRQHQRVQDLLVLVSGRVATLVAFPDVGDLVVETIEGRGRIFGWSGLRPPCRATATVRADGPCEIMTLPIAALTSDRPRWQAALCGLIAADLADRSRDIAIRWSAVPAGDGDA